MMSDDFGAMWRTLECLAAFGGEIPAELVALDASRTLMLDVSRSLPSPEAIVRKGLHGVDSEATAQALLDDYIDATTRKEHAGHLFAALDPLAARELRDTMLVDGLDKMLASARPAFEERILKPMLAYVDAVPATSHAGAVINLGDDAVQAWRDVAHVPQLVRQLIAQVFQPLAYSAGVMPHTTETIVWEKVAAFLTADPSSLKDVALATQQVTMAGSSDDPLGELRKITGFLRLNTLSEARAVVAQAERAFNPMWTGGTAEEFNAWFTENVADDVDAASQPASDEPAPAKSSRAKKKPRPSGIVEN